MASPPVSGAPAPHPPGSVGVVPFLVHPAVDFFFSIFLLGRLTSFKLVCGLWGTGDHVGIIMHQVHVAVRLTDRLLFYRRDVLSASR